jgi:ubiquinone/menaquinone biosynthesis C-methylase UbiE
MDEHLHSQRRLGDWRDDLWNIDFLRLMADRLGLATARYALDVGCGLGHWTRALGKVLHTDIEFVGIDREVEWARRARASSAKGLPRIAFCAGEAGRLPFADESFDLVTCQTLLIHLNDPLQAVREMARVLRPSGTLLLAEPNNLAQRATYGSSQYNAGLVDVIPMTWKLQYVCERGKAALGRGFNSSGDMLPNWLAQAGLQDIKVYLSDKTLPLMPPYQKEIEPELIGMLEKQVQSRQWTWTEGEARAYFLAGGGSAEEFVTLWHAVLAEQADILSAIRRGEFYSAGGFLMYLASGKKPG